MPFTHLKLNIMPNKQLDFDGATIYCGIDTHKLSWRVNIRDEDFELHDFTQPACPKTLYNHLRKNYPGAKYKVAYEAGFCGFGIQRQLTELGIECILLNAADIPKSDKDRKQKSDKRDARSICHYISMKKDLQGLYVPTPQWEHARTLVRHRQQQVTDCTRCKNRIWQLLNFSGLTTPDKRDFGQYWSRKFIKKLEEMDCGGSLELKVTLELKLQDYLQKRSLLLKSTRAIRSLCKQDAYSKQINLLLSIPGIGKVNSAIILFELQEMRRFKTFDNLCSYVGLVPDTNDSGETKINKGITYRHNPFLRDALVESSWMVITKDPAMLVIYKKYCKRMHKNKAIIRVARHLLSRIKYVLTQEKSYEKAIVSG
jgi:transposase